MEGIANYFCQKGFTCWIMEWRNHGESEKPKQKFNFETIALFDIKFCLNYLFFNQKIKSLDCITHSGGGINLVISLIDNPNFKSKINSITMFGTQAFGAGFNLLSRTKIVLAKYLTLFLGKIPSGKVGSTEEDESYHTMKQWFNWNISRNFKGGNDIDYKSKMKEIDIPILSICAKGDTFIAPKIGCEMFLNAFDNPKNKFLYLSKENNNLENYNHSRIIKSSSSRKEVWPLVSDWISENKN